ncbi:C40 family peptidase [Rhodobacter sp. NTK016B]|uniref:NlpC/P60 family protein n=1 Tax=Rhodobacter sp. NTK016B TaxID=2759676 RepID=UPI001A8DE105|nr:C40 family peptidase [Rhodobacter sp. NTK016B]
MAEPERRAALVAEARCWLGTPYCHQASARGAGCDCLGLVRGVWRALKGDEPEHLPPYSADWGESGGDEVLWQGLARHLRRVQSPLLPGDILLFRMRSRGVAKHLGILSLAGSAPRFIHAYCGHGVVESPLSRPWARRIAARFEMT